MKCEECPNAIWDYETFYNTTARQWFVCGCKRNLTEAECNEGEDDD